MKLISTACLLFFGCSSFAQTAKLKAEIQKIIENKKATVGISIVANNFHDTISVNGNVHFPMQSVYKFPIALAVLSVVDDNKLKLDQKIVIAKSDLLPDTWSPIRERFPNGTEMTIAEIIRYTVSKSDNNGCDILLRLIGGTDKVEDFLLRNKLSDISVKASEKKSAENWNVQFMNWSTPIALTNLLMRAYDLNILLLSRNNYQFIWQILENTSTGEKMLRGKLPKNTFVAHKTGTSGMKNNITAATNDIGVVKLPDGSVFFISILITNSSENSQSNQKIIADIAKATYDFYSKQ